MKNIDEITLNFKRGKQLYKSGKLKEACDCFSQAIGVDPYHLEALIFLGMIAMQAGQTQRALYFFSHAQEELPASISLREHIVYCMQTLGLDVRVNLKSTETDVKEFDNISVGSLNIRSGLPYPENSVSYLRVEEVKSFYSQKIRWMKEFLRVCGEEAILEINMGWHREMGLERKKLWKYHDFYCFDLNSPGYYKYSEIDAADGALLLKRIGSQANGDKRELTAMYRVVKDRAKIEWLKAQQTLSQRESVIGHRSTGTQPKFSIIIPHYQGSIDHDHFLRGIRSIHAQMFRDFEILCYHDGPLLDAGLDFPVKIFPTSKRYNDWGHSLRDIGIHEARGEYILHFNPDNILYPQALERLSGGCKEILVFPLIMMGMERDGDLVFQHNKRTASQKMVISGNPVVYGGIDCTQFVMKRDRWLECGGWFDKRGNADGFMYPLFAEKYDVEFIGSEPLGEHW